MTVLINNVVFHLIPSTNRIEGQKLIRQGKKVKYIYPHEDYYFNPEINRLMREKCDLSHSR
jgi:hypothetical protein